MDTDSVQGSVPSPVIPLLKHCHSKRGAYQGRVTKAGHAVEAIKATDEGTWNVSELDNLQHDIDQQVAPFGATQDYILTNYYANEEDDETAEVVSAQKFDDSVTKWTKTIRTMKAVATIHRRLTELRKAVVKTKEPNHMTTNQLASYKTTQASINMDGQGIIDRNERLAAIQEEIEETIDSIEQRVEDMMTTSSPEIDGGRHASTGGPIDRTHERIESHATKRLPRIQIPTFTGDIMEWPHFWDIFDRNVCNNSDLAEDEKITYLQQAIQDKTHKNLIDATSAVPGRFNTYVTSLKARYDRKRKRHARFTTDFFKCQPCKTVTEVELHNLHSTLSNAVQNLRFTEQFTADAIATSFAETLLPADLLTEWYLKETDPHVVPSIDTLLEFIEVHANLPRNEKTTGHKPRLEKDSNPEKSRPSDRPKYDRRVKQEERPTRRVYTAGAGSQCTLCKEEGHALFYCPKYMKFDVERRSEHVRNQALCYNCLSHGHNTQACHSSYRCKRCGRKHHTTLHKEPQAPEAAEQRPVSSIEVTGPVRTTPVIIPTVQLTAHGTGNRQHRVHAMMDSGATVCLIRAKLARQLGLKFHKMSTQIIGVSNAPAGQAQALVKVALTSSQMPTARIEIAAYALDTLAGTTPAKALTQPWKFLDELTLADPDFRIPKEVDIILGQDVLDEITLEGQLVGTEDYPRALKTTFGWVVAGRTQDRELPSDLQPTARCYRAVSNATPAEQLLAAQVEGNEIIKHFWKTESVPEHDVMLTPEEATAVTHFEKTHKVMDNGRFQVTLPRKENPPELGVSRPQAVRRFISNERALLRKNQWAPFQAVIREYLTLGHAERIPTQELNSPSTDHYYLPMHAVVKEASTSTKLRVVFDASATTSTGSSFNETLLVGPTVYPPLNDILMRFRTYRVALTADITKMYRAIELAEGDKNYHRFVWREGTEDSLTDYRMTRLTFGVSASPFLATKALQQAALDNMTTHPHAANTVLSAFYVDDCIAGADRVEEAISLRNQLQLMLTPYDLILRKWRSSSRSVMMAIPPDLHEKQVDPDDVGYNHYLKTLGIFWDDKSDNFHGSISELQLPTVVTKRLLSSDIARTFDVLGWFTPVTVIMKVLIQRLWELKVEWDGVVPAEIQEEWTEWKNTLPQLAQRPLKRSYFRNNSHTTKLTLHGFADASIKAYAAVIYIRAEYETGPPTVELVTAKSRVAPLKPFTIPRLELCAAHLLAVLMSTVRKALNIPLEDAHGWTDSTIVLNWLDGSPRRYKTYVANRIANTLEHMPSTHWKHVPTQENPADCASREITPPELMSHHLWWKGPPWLEKTPIAIPPQPTLSCEPLEMQLVINVTSTSEPWLVLKYSNYQRLRRVVAWILRYIHNLQLDEPERITTSWLTADELHEADTTLQRQAQERSFNSHKPQEWKVNKKLIPLNSFKDAKGILRVGGRLGNAALTNHQIHPVILKGNDCLTTLIIRQHHHSIGHAGPQLLMAHLSREYYILQGMRAVKGICRCCTTCKKYRVRTEVQLMGQLPPHRVNPGRTFSIVGTDFAGPITTKYGYVRKPTLIKTYVCIFVCMSTKAVHLEAVSDLTSEAFLSCLTRFIGRRGRPTAIHSDNGSNFIGAANELNRMFQFMKEPTTQDAVNNFCATRHITWHFNPARAPHHGGIWEAGVKSMKYHLRRITEGHRLTFEELATVLVQVESMLNSRPLIPLHSHSEEGLDVLTPGHFIIGAPLESLPEAQAPTQRSLLKRWNLQRKMSEDFWARWSADYLRTLHRRSKWTTVKPNIHVGDIVLIREDGIFANNWPLARITKTFPGKDGLVRAVELRTATTTLTRPITKVSVLVSPSGDIQDSPNRGQSSPPGCSGSPGQD